MIDRKAPDFPGALFMRPETLYQKILLTRMYDLDSKQNERQGYALKILVSACLPGIACRYDGNGAQNRGILSFMDSCFFVPVCPEIMGGLPTPRDPAEIIGGRVKTIRGVDVTENYERGALQTVNMALLYGCELALLKERSPSRLRRFS